MAEIRFEGSGPVARYWLANCKGFAVTGGARGVVEEMLRDADPHVTTGLVVRTRVGRRTVVPSAAVAAVVPSERVLVVASRRRPGPSRTETAVRASAPVALAAGRRVGSLTARAAGGASAGVRRHGPVATAAAAGAAARAGAVLWRLVTAAAAALAGAVRGRNVHGHAARAVRGSFVVLAAEARATVRMLERQPKPYVPLKRSASRRTRRDAGRPTTFR